MWLREVDITVSVIDGVFMSSRQADQASSDTRRIHTRGGASVWCASARGSELPYARTSGTSELTFRVANQFHPDRQGRRHGVGGLVRVSIML